jgi:hypothetical protein
MRHFQHAHQVAAINLEESRPMHATDHQALPEIDAGAVLAKAARNAAQALGLSQVELGEAIGRARSSLARPLDPASKSGELAALLIRCYRSLFVLTGGEPEAMSHWMTTFNLHTGGVPREQIRQVQGLVTVTEYLDAVRGKL